ncbi:hypothetical protein OS11_24200 [Dickeya oryzae]
MEKRTLNKNIGLLLSGFTELKDNGRFNEPNLDGSIGDYISFSSWEWPQGVGLFGLVRLWENNKSNSLYQIIDNWFQKNIEKGLPGLNVKYHRTDASLIAFLVSSPAAPLSAGVG